MENIILPLFITLIAGISTIIGAIIFLILKNIKSQIFSFFLGISAGAMIYLAFLELMPQAIQGLGFAWANVYLFGGIILMAIIDFILPQHYQRYCVRNGKEYNRLTMTGIVIIVSMALHNFPEGIAVFLSTSFNVRAGILIALATLLHNIPEGIAIAAPVYQSTKKAKLSLLYSFVAGLAEPLGALLALLVLGSFITMNLVLIIFAIVSGIMIYISLDELLPTCFKHCQEGHAAIIGIVFGMILMGISLTLMPV